MLRTAMLPAPSWMSTKGVTAVPIKVRVDISAVEKLDRDRRNRKTDRVAAPYTGERTSPLASATPKEPSELVNLDISRPLPCSGATPGMAPTVVLNS